MESFKRKRVNLQISTNAKTNPCYCYPTMILLFISPALNPLTSFEDKMEERVHINVTLEMLSITIVGNNGD